MKTVSVILLICCHFLAIGAINLKNNECKSYLDYFTRFFNTNCDYNDEFFLQTPQILSSRNIPYENHTVVTEDGYILSVFRVTKTDPKGVIVMLHPIVQDSTVWFLGGNQSYVTTFSNAGYELWLVNWRGVRYSDKHIRNLTTLEYWDFSFHEIGLYDYSAVFRYVNNVTQTKLIAFSMSIGSTASTIYAAEKPEEAKELIKVFVALAVPAFMQDSTTLIRILLPIVPFAPLLERIFGFGAFFHGYQWLKNLLVKVALLFNTEFPFAVLTSPFVGDSPFGFNPKSIPFGLSLTLEAVSVKCLIHYAQLLTNGNKFTLYDYGRSKNLKLYNNEKPPNYPIENINVPFYIIFGENDNLANKKGNLLLYSKLPAVAQIYGYFEVLGSGHAGFVIGKDAPIITQNQTLDLLEKV